MIYLDNNATTRVPPEIVEAMLPFFTERWGNPSSLHTFGAQVAKPIDTAREQVAALLGAQRPSEIVFTAGGTESNHLAIRGLLAAHPDKRRVVTTTVEHPSVLRLLNPLEQEGYTVVRIGVDMEGRFNWKAFETALTADTALATVIWANNETGVLFPIDKMAALCNAKQVPLHTDAVQAAGKIAINVRKAPVDCLSVSGHKFHAPKGIGALYVRRGTKIMPLVTGGRQERGLRAGTENVPGIVGLGKAAEMAKQRFANGTFKKVEALRNRLEEALLKIFPAIRINGKASPRVPNTSNISFEGLDGETICLLLSEAGIAASTGSACSAGSLEPSHVLKSMGLNHKQAKGAVRFSLSGDTTDEEIEKTVAALNPILQRLKK